MGGLPGVGILDIPHSGPSQGGTDEGGLAWLSLCISISSFSCLLAQDHGFSHLHSPWEFSGVGTLFGPLFAECSWCTGQVRSCRTCRRRLSPAISEVTSSGLSLLVLPCISLLLLAAHSVLQGPLVG